jgi:hypothetical protein
MRLAGLLKRDDQRSGHGMLLSGTDRDGSSRPESRGRRERGRCAQPPATAGAAGLASMANAVKICLTLIARQSDGSGTARKPASFILFRPS